MHTFMPIKQKMTWWTLVLLLVLGSGAGWQLFASGGNEINYNFVAVSNAGFFVWIAVYFMAGICLLFGRNDLQKALRRDAVAIALLSFVVMSALWSNMPSYALYTALQLVFLSVFAMMAGQQLSLKQAWSATMLAFTIMVVASFVFIIALPELGIVQATQNKGAWRGAYLEKNIFGTFLVLASATALVGMLVLRGWRRCAAIAAWMICILTLIPSKATSAALIALGIPVVMLVLGLLRAGGLRTLIAFGVLLPVSGIAIVSGLLFSENMLDFMGKDTSLTGRDELWDYALTAIERRPFGFGFGSFWDDAGPFGGVDLTRSIIWRPRSAHNVWLETTLQIGLLGTFLFLIFMIQSIYRAGQLACTQLSPISRWPFLVLYILLCFGAVETNLLIHQSVSHALLFLVTAGVARDLESSSDGNIHATGDSLEKFSNDRLI